METPSKTEVLKDVKHFIYMFSRHPEHLIENDYKLEDHPLQMDRIQILRLLMALRAYVKNINNSARLYASEISSITIMGLSYLVYSKIE